MHPNDSDMKNLRIILLLAGFTCFVGTPRLYAQRGSASKTITTTRLADVQTTFERTEAIPLETQHEMLIEPLIASVEVLGTGSGTAKQYTCKTFSGEYLMSKIENVKGISFYNLLEELYVQLKANVIYDFCTREKADLIVMPQFKIEHKMEMKTMNDENGTPVTAEVPCERNGKYVMQIEVRGYPAKYTGFRRGAENDAWIKELFMEGTLSNSNETSTTQEETAKKAGSR